MLEADALKSSVGGAVGKEGRPKMGLGPVAGLEGTTTGFEDSVRGASRSESIAGVVLREAGGEIRGLRDSVLLERSVVSRTGGGRSNRRTMKDRSKTCVLHESRKLRKG